MTKKNEEPRTIYVRIDPKVRRDFQHFVVRHRKDGLTERSVIERLLGDFMKRTEEERLDFMHGDRVDPIQVFGELIYQNSWSEHVFSTHQWDWAVEEYGQLRDMSASAPGIGRLAAYKLGYAWLEMALQLRDRALDDDIESRDDYYDAARTAVFTALEFNRNFVEEDEGRPVVFYNEACCWMIAAQYGVERLLVAKPEWRERIRRLDDQSDTWAKNMAGWRDVLREESVALEEESSRKVVVSANRAIKALDRAVELRGNGDLVLRRAQTDSDFMMLRGDELTGEAYEAWRDRLRGADRPLLEMFRRLRDRIDPDVLERVLGHE